MALQAHEELRALLRGLVREAASPSWVDYDALCAIIKPRGRGHTRVGVVCRWLADRRIRYYLDERGRPFTTLAAMGLEGERAPIKHTPDFSEL